MNASALPVTSTHDSGNYDIQLQKRPLSQITQPQIHKDNLCDFDIFNSSLLESFDGIDFFAEYALIFYPAMPMPILTASDLVP